MGAVDILPDTANASPARYWMTDGGATDNRGIILLLLNRAPA